MENSLYYFEKIASIPHGSGNSKKIADYIESFAEENGLFYIRDKKDNIIIIKDASKGRENHPAVMIQGHIDMVCEAADGVSHDFLNDGIKLIRNGDILHADGTTLGGDDGAAVALMLELLADKALDAPRLECVFTSDEEIGMLGAKEIDLSPCRAKYLINADSEEEGVFTCGCAGGTELDFSVPVERETVKGTFSEISVSGLVGGHSGTEINKGRLNAILLLAELLSEGDRIVSIERDGKDNAIPKRCDAIVLGNGENIRKKFQSLKNFGCETEVKLSIETFESEKRVLTEESHMKILKLLQNMPYGVSKMCDEPEGLVHTSDNIGAILTDDGKITGKLLIRSINEESRDELAEKITELIKEAGGTYFFHGTYSGWDYRKNSMLRDLMCGVYEDMFKKKAKVEVIHAGVECGILLSKMPELDIVSIGCNLWDIHTPDERMGVSSFERTVEFVRQVLKELRFNVKGFVKE